MQRLYKMCELGDESGFSFSSKASTEQGVFRAFASRYSKCLKESTVYRLIVADSETLAWCPVASAFWNGKAFVKVGDAHALR